MSALSVIWDRYTTGKTGDSPPPQFNLLRWFSLVSLVVIASVAIGLGIISTRFVVTESIERDAMLSSQFIQSIASAEIRHVALPTSMTMGELLDARQDGHHPQHMLEARQRARNEFLDHIAMLPDALLANIYGADRVIVWSTNPALVGKDMSGHDDLEQAFSSPMQVAASYDEVTDRSEQKFLRAPRTLFIENYIPLLDDQGNVASVVEIYKEPRDLVQRIQRGFVLIWMATAIGGGLIYLGLYWIVRRASGLLARQQSQLIANETFVALGEMSSAVAHSLRNPLASIRSSAELAQEMVEPPVRKNIDDIISQVDRMSKWVRELLISARPLSGDVEAVEPLAVINEALHGFDQQIRHSGVRVEFHAEAAPAVVSHRVLLAQVLNSLFANAIEAMPNGGLLRIEVAPDSSGKRLLLAITDTGQGMTRKQETMAFKPYYTTKQGGLGVGLVMVKRIMERFGGKVSLTSREREGTRICLSFKVAGGRG
ncbi:sensor histidine kinase [Metapseudomonas resinovorans]|uniref:histidine kinase n=1 Tax=Metapseudomonas resinovorans NBRC 106553 TaxID=1245471 RepID=S6ANU5_METRE|nr:ATP-binding protein [Pseudomonas resinovorans]BAN50710.1 putative two-component histidine kinase [Pseudomonas resinovorans NBRC 106553]